LVTGSAGIQKASLPSGCEAFLLYRERTVFGLARLDSGKRFSLWQVPNTISGTSMASPHVAGVSALILAEQPGLTPAQVADAVVNLGTGNVLSGIKAGSPNLLLRAPQ